MEHCPSDKVLPELLKLQQTINSQVDLIESSRVCTYANSPTSQDKDDNLIVNSIGEPMQVNIEEVTASTLVSDGEVC